MDFGMGGAQQAGDLNCGCVLGRRRVCGEEICSDFGTGERSEQVAVIPGGKNRIEIA